MHTAALVIIGNEILSGRTQDINTSWVAEKLVSMGIILSEVRIVPDEEDRIVQTVNDLRAGTGYVFTTGGIGPTHDDITAQSIAKAFGVPLELHPQGYQALIEHYGSEEVISAPRRKMAMLPQGAELIANPVSGAPGFRIGNVFVMAGVPRVMQAMFDSVIDTLTPGLPVLSNTVTCSLLESEIAEDLAALQNEFPDVQIGSYPHYRGGTLGLSLVMRSTDKDMLDLATKGAIALIRRLGGKTHALSILSTGEIMEG